MLTEYSSYDGLGLAKLVQDGEVSPSELLSAAFEHADRINPRLNAIIHRFDQKAKQAAEAVDKTARFAGVPFLLKDLVASYAGEPQTMGSRGLKNYIAEEDSHLVTRFKQAGLSIFGKTNCPEFGLIITTEPKAHGPAHNPHKRGYSTGGSSGGSAAAVAAGIVPIANADDGGGSIRFPAAWCGVVGLKPSRGRNPNGPLQGEMWDGAVSQHVVSRTVRDTAAMLDCTAGHEPGAPYHIALPEGSFYDASQKDPKKLRIAIQREPLVPETWVDPEVLEALEKTGQHLESLGHHVDYRDPTIDKELFWKSFVVVVASHVAGLQAVVKDQVGAEALRHFEPATKNMAMLGRSLSAKDLVLAKMHWHEICQAHAEVFKDYDVILSPTVPTVAERHGILPPKKQEEIMMEWGSHFNIGKWVFASGMVRQLGLPVLQKMAYTIAGNITGLPGISLPTHMSKSGLPIGMQFTADMNEEATLLSLAGQLERSGWMDGTRGVNTP